LRLGDLKRSSFLERKPMDKETRDYVDKAQDAMAAKLREELKSHIQDNCARHKHQMEQSQNEVAQELAQHSITLTKLTSLVEHDRNLLGQKIDQLTEVTTRLLKIVEGNGKGSLAERISLQEQIAAAQERQLTKIWEKLDSKKAVWTKILVQGLPTLLTWLGFIAFWIVYHMGSKGVPPVTP